MKKSNIIFIALFLVISLIPFMGAVLLGPSEAAANEILRPMPTLFDDEMRLNRDYLNKLSDRFADTFALRQEFITAWSFFNSELLATSVEPQVTLGKGNWLFYTSTLDDYRGITLSDREIYMAANNLALMQEYAAECGAKFAFTVAPNKNSLYPQYMPASITKGAKSNAMLLSEQLIALGVNYVDMFKAFSRDEVLYYETDSHWNSRGAALAADMLLGSLGRESNYFSNDFSSVQEHRGDLYDMLYPCGKHSDKDPVYSHTLDFSCRSEPNGGKAIVIYTDGGGEGKLLCWRDSFANNMYPYLAAQFESAQFARAVTYDLTEISLFGYDHLVIELVERNIKQLVEKAPVLPAPLRSVSVTATGEGCMGQITEKKGLSNVSVVIPAEWTDYAADAYIATDAGYYEACQLSGKEGCIELSAWFETDLEIIGVITVQNGEGILHPLEITEE